MVDSLVVCSRCKVLMAAALPIANDKVLTSVSVSQPPHETFDDFNNNQPNMYVFRNCSVP